MMRSRCGAPPLVLALALAAGSIGVPTLAHAQPSARPKASSSAALPPPPAPPASAAPAPATSPPAPATAPPAAPATTATPATTAASAPFTPDPASPVASPASPTPAPDASPQGPPAGGPAAIPQRSSAPPPSVYTSPPPYGYGAPWPPGEAYEPPKQRVWYGWKTIILHSISATMLFVAPAGDGNAAGYTVTTAITGMVLAGPIVHWSHGHVSRGFGALGLQFGGAGVGGLLGGLTACSFGACGGNHGEEGFLIGFAFGAPIGAITAFIIDVSVLSFDPRTDQTDLEGAKGLRAPSFALVPLVDIRPDRSTFGLGGTF